MSYNKYYVAKYAGNSPTFLIFKWEIADFLTSLIYHGGGADQNNCWIAAARAVVLNIISCSFIEQFTFIHICKAPELRGLMISQLAA